jgi:hypothetical protein
MRVEILEPDRVLSNRSEAGDWVRTFVLVPENGSTRLISRNRIALKGAATGQRLGMLVMEPGSFPGAPAFALEGALSVARARPEEAKSWARSPAETGTPAENLVRERRRAR